MASQVSDRAVNYKGTCQSNLVSSFVIIIYIIIVNEEISGNSTGTIFQVIVRVYVNLCRGTELMVFSYDDQVIRLL